MGQPSLDAVYAAVFIDAIVVKVRDGQVANRPVYAAIGVTVDGCKDGSEARWLTEYQRDELLQADLASRLQRQA